MSRRAVTGSCHPRMNGEVSLVPLADVDPLTLLAVWDKDRRHPVMLSAIDLIEGHGRRDTTGASGSEPSTRS